MTTLMPTEMTATVTGVDRVLVAVERPRQDDVQRMRREAHEEDAERGSDGSDGSFVEAGPEEQFDGLISYDDADGRDEQRGPEQQPQGAGDDAPELSLAAPGERPRHGRQQHDPEWQAHDAKRNLKDVESDAVGCDGADRDGRCEQGVDEERDLVRAQADGARQHEEERLTRRLVLDVDAERVAEAAAQRRQLDEQVGDGPDDDTHRGSRHAEGRCQEARRRR